MRLVIIICAQGLLLANGYNEPSHAPQQYNTLNALHNEELTIWETQNICPALVGQNLLEAGTIAAEFFTESVQVVAENELKLLGGDMILKCIRATCPEAIPSLANAIGVYDQNGTFEGMKQVILSSITHHEIAKKLWQYIEALEASETADVILDLYRRARLAANMGHVPLSLTEDDFWRIGSFTWMIINRSV